MNKEIKEAIELILETLKDKIPKVTFDETLHRYTDDEENVYYSVTQILHSINYYKFKDIPVEVLNNKAKIGTMTHEYGEILYADPKSPMSVTEFMMKVDPLELWGFEYRSQLTGYLQAMKNYWIKEGMTSRMFASEFKFISKKHSMAGTVDNLRVDNIMGQGPRFSISDYKTSATIDPFTQGLQLAGYGKALNDLLEVEMFTHGVLVQLKKDGTYKEHWFKLDDYEDRWDLLKTNFDVNIKPILK